MLTQWTFVNYVKDSDEQIQDWNKEIIPGYKL